VTTKEDLLTKLRTARGGPVDLVEQRPAAKEVGSKPDGQNRPTEPRTALVHGRTTDDGLLVAQLERRLRDLEHPGEAAAEEKAQQAEHRKAERDRIANDLVGQLGILRTERAEALDTVDSLPPGTPRKAAVEVLYLAARREYSLCSWMYGKSIMVERPSWSFPSWAHSRNLTHPTLLNATLVKKPTVPLPEDVQDLVRQFEALA